MSPGKEEKVLITGGAGFIGQHLTRALLGRGLSVRVLDNFSPQIHRVESLAPDLAPHVDLIKGDIRDADALKKSLEGVDTVVHLAAETGTGQSMYEIQRYFSVNVQGTAELLHLLQNDPSCRRVKNIVVASSRAIYGEGAYRCEEHGIIFPDQRRPEEMSKGDFDPQCERCGKVASLIPTPESAPYKPMSVYGLTKQVQEQAVLMFAKTNGINAFGLRYQNVYGPGQSLKNPYTGILAVFSNLARQGQPIDVYEDGLESRDFVYIDDVVAATMGAVTYAKKFVGALNVGTGQGTSVMAVAQKIKAHFKSESSISVSGNFRIGDIRHNIADQTMSERLLSYRPRIMFDEGLMRFLTWAESQPSEDGDAYKRSVGELAAKGLMGKASGRA